MIESPQYIYKYHQMNLHLIELLTNAEFHMSRRCDLNDPFENIFKISLDSYLNLYFERYPSLKNDQEQINRVKFCFTEGAKFGEYNWVESIDESISRLKVTCFTEDNNNPLMWSYYSLNHTGVCLKFDTSKDLVFKQALSPVTYENELVEVKKIEDISKCLLTKLKDWSIEKEWRIIAEKDKFPFQQEALVEVIFGLRTTDLTLRWFKQFFENVYYMHAPIYRLKIRNNQLIKVDEYDDEVD